MMGYNIWTTTSSMKISALQSAAFNKPYITHEPTTRGDNIATHLIFLCGLNPIIQILGSQGIIKNGGKMSVELKESYCECSHNIMIQVSMAPGEFVKRIARDILHDVRREQRKIGT
jgi:hypothetical protein